MGGSLPERVAQMYYTYGLFCSSYPLATVSAALAAVLLCCYPLLNVPLPGNVPTVVNLPLEINKAQLFTMTNCKANKCHHTEPPTQLDLYMNNTQKLSHVWAKERPLFFVQQIVMKIGVFPWTNNLQIWDAFRAPLQEAFRLLETIRNHEDPETKSTLLHHCYQIEGIKKQGKASLDSVLPEYSCLLLSPANLWQQNLQTFSLDAHIISTIYNYQNLQKSKTSIAEMAFGMPLRDAGVKRYPLRARPRVLQFAATVFYRQADYQFIQSLTKKLKEMYPLYQDTPVTQEDQMTLIYYPGKFNYHELVPLLITFVGLFLYVYFSVRKIEFIKSKLGLAACAVLTIAGSLAMAMGICYFFEFSLSLQGKEIFPYLVVIVGLENVLVLTKSVTSTDWRLDVKIRLAQGLSREGWSITKNLLTEITIFTVSFFTFVPFIQEFSIFMIVSLISDYFIQMTFFATVLGIDVRRMELFQEQNSKLHLKEYFNASNALNWRYNKSGSDESTSPGRMTKSKSHPRLNGLAQGSPTAVVARSAAPAPLERVPKRIRLVNLWARTRFFQRAFMLWMLVWISMIIYNSGVVEYFISNVDKGEVQMKKANERVPPPYAFQDRSPLVFPPMVVVDERERAAQANDTVLLKHNAHLRPCVRLSPYHWSAILSQYNETLAGRHVALLPPLLLSQRIGPELAAGLRHPDEKEPLLRWQALAAALDPIDTLPEFDPAESKAAQGAWGQAAELPMYPTTPMEILLLAILCSISVAVIAYMMVVLYRCVCSRHYAEWRASWNDDDEYKKIIAKQPAVQLVMEAVPVVVSGHSQEVECVVTDGERVVSCCLQGHVKVWDSQNGDVLTNIDRSAFFKLQKQLHEKVHSKIDSSEDSTPSNDGHRPVEVGTKLRKGLKHHLSGLRFRPTAPRTTPAHLSRAETTKYDFVKHHRELYCSDDDPYGYHEAKENVDVNNFNLSKSDLNDTSCKDNLDVNKDDYSSLYSCSDNDHSIVSVLNKNSKNRGDEEAGGRKSVRDSPVWCMDFCNDLVILGCADGRLEFWEASSGKLMCLWWGAESRSRSGAVGTTHVRALAGARRVCAAFLGGHLALVRLDAYNAASGAHVDWRFSTAHRRTHKRTGSAGSLRTACGGDATAGRTRMSFSYESDVYGGEEVVCTRVAQCRPHQQPITEMVSEGGRVLTGGQDHVLKVFSSADLSLQFTLHGHCGPITSCFIDHATPTIAGSGSQDGLLCVWDLHTGACLYSTQAHDGAVTSLAYTASYVVSAGTDERLCIWDRFQGHMLNSIHIGLNYMSRMLPLTHTLLVIGDRSGITVYDLSSGDVIRRVLFGKSDGCIFVRQILPLRDAIVCDYASQLRIVRFPLVSRLCDMKSE